MRNKISTLMTIVFILGMTTISIVANLNNKQEKEVAPTVQVLPNLKNISLLENVKMATSKSEFKPTVRLFIRGSFVCTGTIIDSSYVLTAAHCLVDDTGFMLKDISICLNKDFSDSCTKMVFGKPAAINSGTDNALILGDFSEFKTEKINIESDVFSKVKQMVATCGFPYGMKGICYSAEFNPQPLLYKVKTNGLLFPGMSGGPVRDISAKEVIGVNSSVGNGFITITTLIGLHKQFRMGVDR